MRKLIRKVKQDCRQQQNGKFAGCLPALRQEGVYVRRGQLKDSIPMSVQDDWFDVSNTPIFFTPESMFRIGSGRSELD
jgi:hypothetical protein